MESVSSKIHQLWRSYIFWKCSKLNQIYKTETKKWENIFRFLYYCSWKSSYNIFLLRREYLLSAVSRLTNSPKIFHITERVFKPELPSKGSINMVKVPSFRFQQCLARLLCYLSKGPLKPDFLDIYLTTPFGFRSKIRQLWGSCSFWKCLILKLNWEDEKRNQKVFFVSEVIASLSLAINPLY